MAKDLQTLDYLNFLGALQTAVSPFLVADNELTLMSNVNVTYRLGSIIKRLGYSQVGDTLQASKSITGLHNFRQNSATQKILATVNNSGGTALVLKYNSAGTWTTIDTSTTYTGYEDTIVEMEDFIGYCFIVGYDSTDGVFLPVGSLTGTTFSTSTNVTDMPQGKYIKRYRDRLYVANCYYGAVAYPYRVCFSSVPSAGTITWTTATDYLDVDYSEAITGIGENWDKMLIFTEYSAYLYNQEEWKKSWDVGCSNHRTIKNSGIYTIWANRDGVWQSTGGFPQNIAGRIIDFIRYGDPTSFFAEVIDEEYNLYVGNVTVNGISYSNCAVIWNIPTQTWRVEEYYDTISIYARYNSSGDDFLYMGCSDGEVMVKSKYTDTTPVYTDDGQPINAIFQTKIFDFGAPSVEKEFAKIIAYAEKGSQLTLKTLIVDNNTRGLLDPKAIGQCSSYISDFTPAITKGNFLQITGSENSTNPYFIFNGFSLLVGSNTKLK